MFRGVQVVRSELDGDQEAVQKRFREIRSGSRNVQESGLGPVQVFRVFDGGGFRGSSAVPLKRKVY